MLKGRCLFSLLYYIFINKNKKIISMSKGFTLIELLIVIGILAILATATILVLNPTELFAQARDAQRLSDLDTLRSAISLYLTSVTGASLQDATAPAFVCGTHFGNSSLTAAATNRTAAVGEEGAARRGIRTVAGVGWLPVNFAAIPGGSPFGVLPVDPTNDGTNNYQYSCNDALKTFELNTLLQSTKYATTDDFDGKDGGSNIAHYETGNDPALDL